VGGNDHETTIKRNLPIASAITALDPRNGQSVILFICESICNKASNNSLLLEFQLRQFRIMIDSIPHKHGGTQQMIVKYNKSSDALAIPLVLVGYMIHFRHRLPTSDEIATINSIVQQREMPHGIQLHSLIKLYTSFINKSLIQKITMLVLQIFRIPQLLRLPKLVQSCPCMTHQTYLQIIFRVN
jgi:hypothetical protein